MKKSFTLISIVLLACCNMAYTQVTNQVSTYIKPGTEVHVYSNLVNSSTGNLEVGTEGLLYVDGTLVNNGTMTFNNASSLLRGDTGNDGTGTGTYHVKRQGSNNIGVYNFWSSPMQSFSGVPGGENYLYDPMLGTQTYTDDQPADPGWVAYDGLMIPGSGYAGRGGGLATFSGDVNNGSVSYPLFYTPDIPGNTAPNTPFNLVGNPYPSGIQAIALVTSNPDISGALYFWDDDLSGGSGYSNTDYAVWNFTGSLGTGSGNAGAPNGIISSGQGFKVMAINSGAILNFENYMRVSNTTQFFRVNGDNARMWLSIEGNNYFNQLLIGLHEDATEGEDRLYDATKLRGNSDISLSAINDGKDYCILAFPPPAVEKTVPLSVYVNSEGIYTFKPNTMENFEYHNVFLVDVENNTQYTLQEGTEIPIHLNAGEYNNRFFLNFQSNGMVGIEAVEPYDVSIYTHNSNLHLASSQLRDINASLDLFDISGKLVLSKENVLLTTEPKVLSLTHLAKSVYIVRLVIDGKVFNAKVINQ